MATPQRSTDQAGGAMPVDVRSAGPGVATLHGMFRPADRTQAAR